VEKNTRRHATSSSGCAVAIDGGEIHPSKPLASFISSRPCAKVLSASQMSTTVLLWFWVFMIGMLLLPFAASLFVY
jgi:hypothetical protein